MNRLFSVVLLSSGIVLAAPQGGIVVSGDANIEQQGIQTTITQSSQQAWIDWQQFNIAADEQVTIHQLVNNGLTVNRVTGNNASDIFGQLNSNGTVYLINPNGVLFSENSQLNVGSLFVSDYWLDTDATLTKLNHNSSGIQLLGSIRSQADLKVLSDKIYNSGDVHAKNIELMGGDGALLTLDDHGALNVLVPADSNQPSSIANTGVLIADEKIYLGSANKNDWLNHLAAQSQQIVSGDLVAQSIDINGSSIELVDAQLTAQLIDIESQNRVELNQANLQAEHGQVRIRGEEIQLHSNSLVDVGHGDLTIGGRYQGQGDDNNAQFVHVSSTVQLYGNAGTQGDGGEIIIWSDGTTSFHGSIEAKGGSQQGDGGFVEVSGKEHLVFRGDVDTQAKNGANGMLLLDPDVITIVDFALIPDDDEVTGDGIVLQGDTPVNMTITEEALEGLADTTDITLQANQAIIINDLSDNALTLDQTGNVTFTVANSTGEGRFQMLDLNDAIEMTGGGNLSINVSGNIFQASTTNSVTVEIGDINFTAGGNLIVNAFNSQAGVSSSDMNVTLGNVSIEGDGDLNIGISNSSGNDIGASTLSLGGLSVTGTGSNQLDIAISSDNGVAAIVGASTLNLNGNISINGDASAGHYVNIDLDEDGAVAGTLNSYGDINTLGGDFTLSAGQWELLDDDGLVEVIAMSDFLTGGSVDLTALTALSIDGNGNSFAFASAGDHNLDWDEFSNLDLLFYRTNGDVTLGVDGIKDVSNAELGLIDAAADRFTVQTSGDITASNATTTSQLSLYADRDSNGTGSVVLNGLVTTNSNLLLQGADISGDGSVTDAGTGTVTIEGIASQDISIGAIGTSTFNIEPTTWNNISASNKTVTVNSASTIWWEHNTLGGDVTLDATSGTGIVFQGSATTFSGANNLQLIGDSYFAVDVSMTNASTTLDIDGDLHIGSIGGGGGDTVTVSAIWDTVGMTSVDLIGDAGDAASLVHIGDTDFSLANISSSNGVNLDLLSNGSITASDLTVGDLVLDFEKNSNASGANQLTLSGTNSVNGLTLIGSNTNDLASMAGDITIAGDFSVFSLGTLNVSNDNINANAINMTSLNNLQLGAGNAFTMQATAGDILLPAQVTADRQLSLTSSGTINIKGLGTDDDRINLLAADVQGGTGINIDAGAALVQFQVQSGSTAMSIGDGGSDTFTIESNIWDNLAAGSIVLDAIGSDDTITFLEDTLPANLSVDGPDGTLTFAGTGQNFSGASVITTTDVTFLQNFTSDTEIDINGEVNIGATDGSAGDAILIAAPLWFSGVTAINLLGDTGDDASLSSSGTTGLNVAAVSSPNGNPSLSLSSEAGMNLNGFSGGALNILIDSDDDGSEALIAASANYNTVGLTISGTSGNDSLSLAGDWASTSSATVATVADITFTGNSFTSWSPMSIDSSVPITLGTSTTAFTLASNNHDLTFGNITGNRPLNLSAAGIVSAGEINVASRPLAITADSDSTGDEQITATYIQSGDLTMDGDFDWTFNPVISGDYVQTAGDVSLTDVSLSAFSIDLTTADSVTLAGTSNSLEARSGAVSIDGATDDGSNANLTIAATTQINVANLDTGSGAVSLDSDTDTSGDESITLTNNRSGLLSIADDATLGGTLNVSAISTTKAITFNDANLTLASLNNATWADTVFSGSANTLDATAGDITLTTASDDGSNANLTLNAAGAVNLTDVNNGSGDVSLNANTNNAGGQGISITDSQGGNLSLNNDAQLNGTLVYANLSSTAGLTFNAADLSVASFDSGNFTSVNLTGATNTIAVRTGDLILDTPTIASGADLNLSVGTGSHVLNNINLGSGDLSLNGLTGSTGRQVTANGAWTFNNLSIRNIDSFISNAQLNAGGNVVANVGDWVLNDGSTLSAEKVSIVAANDVTLTGITANADGIPNVEIRAGGDLFDGGDTNADISVAFTESILLDIAGNQQPLEISTRFEGNFDEITQDVAAVNDSEHLVAVDDSESNDPTESEQASVGSLPKSRVDVYVSQCSSNKKECKKKNAVRKFLSALLVGGALPE